MALARRIRPGADPTIDWIEADLRRRLPLRTFPKRIDAIVHLASVRQPSTGHGVEELFAVNVAAVAALMEYARLAGARRFVLGSTGGVCGYRPDPIRETTPVAPFDAYTLSKWLGELASRHYERHCRISVGIIRYFFPYGPGQRTGIIPRLAQRIGAGIAITVYRRGRQPRLNPVYVDDAAELTRRVLGSHRSLLVNSAGPETATVRQIADLLSGILGRAPQFESARNPGIGDMVGSNAAARRLLDFVPLVGLGSGLASTFVRP